MTAGRFSSLNLETNSHPKVDAFNRSITVNTVKSGWRSRSPFEPTEMADNLFNAEEHVG